MYKIFLIYLQLNPLTSTSHYSGLGPACICTSMNCIRILDEYVYSDTTTHQLDDAYHSKGGSTDTRGKEST